MDIKTGEYTTPRIVIIALKNDMYLNLPIVVSLKLLIIFVSAESVLFRESVYKQQQIVLTN